MMFKKEDSTHSGMLSLSLPAYADDDSGVSHSTEINKRKGVKYRNGKRDNNAK